MPSRICLAITEAQRAALIALTKKDHDLKPYQLGWREFDALKRRCLVQLDKNDRAQLTASGKALATVLADLVHRGQG